MYRSQLKITTQEMANAGADNCNNSSNKNDTALAPIKKLTLRDNQLHGSILIGNYHYLTHLEVCDNELESLDLSSLKKLETLKCNHNRLMELVLSGEQLITVSLQCNNLHTLNVTPTPHKLKYMNLSHNNFMEMPSWLGSSPDLQILNVSYNRIQNINDFLNNYNISDLRQLHLGFNQLQSLAPLPDKLSSLQQFYLQGNDLQKLPDNAFNIMAARLVELNVSGNKLCSLPKLQHTANTGMCLEQLYLSSNRLTERIFDASLSSATKLRVFHAAYNKIANLPDLCMHKWPELEVLVLSGNMLQHVPPGISKLTKLQVLRLHSNLLLSTPSLCKLGQLKVLDLAHNHLDHINLLQLVPAQLKYLDLSCNLQLQVDEKELVACQTKRKWSLIDVSGKNRSALPTLKMEIHDNYEHVKQKSANAQKPPWMVGFSETPGLKCRKLLISQLRLSNLATNCGLFGMFESMAGKSASHMSGIIRQMSLKLQQQLLHNHQAIAESMKSAVQQVCEQLVNMDHNNQLNNECSVSAVLCHITKESLSLTMQQNNTKNASKAKGKHFVLRFVSFGNICAYLVRKTSNICLTATPIVCQNDNFEDAKGNQEHVESHVVNALNNFSSLVESKKFILSNDDEYLIVSNNNLWQYIDIDRVTRELRKEDNMILAAKRVQNIAQSFGAQDSLSVLVLRFKNIGTDVDHLLRELKQIGRSRPLVSCLPALTRKPLVTCCNERLGAEKFAGLRSCYTRSERSSPSGQSDHLGASKVNSLDDGKEFASLAHVEEVEVDEEQDMLDETDSILSEEQFKCWEYMLEQNTQLLFDKELNTISKAFSAQNNHSNAKAKYNFPSSDELHVMEDKLSNNKLLPINYNNYNKLKSVSSPHLLFCAPQPTTYQQNLTFLPKPLQAPPPSSGYSYIKTRLQDTLNMGHMVGPSYAKLAGGPNAAYFGSVQRQVPLNFEYDLAAAQLEDEDNFSDEQESRMTKYWGVATTEL